MGLMRHTTCPFTRTTVRTAFCLHISGAEVESRFRRKFIDEYFDDLGKAYREEVRELYDLGCRKLIRSTSASNS